MVLYTNYYGGSFVLTFVKNGNVSWKHLSVECQTFRSYFACHSEHLDKIFTLDDCPYKFSEINVLSELNVRNKYVR